ncbi:MAG TPA: thioredoxin family protein [Aequorivita sp.]|nr:thioredoxin family protein [Aequorivita sp.]
MKKTLIVSALIALIGCNSSKDKKEAENSSNDNTTETTLVNKEELNQTVPYEESILLLGKVDRDGLKMDAFQEWFTPGYEEYKPNPEVMEKLKPLLKDVQITVFMGTWCEDSHRDVPNLYKILDEANFDEKNLSVYATSEEKTTPQDFEKDKDIIQVPTIIFYKDGSEINRIVEYSFYTLEQDMLDILSGKDYKHAYFE